MSAKSIYLNNYYLNKSKLYLGPTIKHVDPKMFTIFKGTFNDKFIIDYNVMQKSLRRSFLVLNEIQRNKKVLVVSPKMRYTIPLLNNELYKFKKGLKSKYREKIKYYFNIKNFRKINTFYKSEIPKLFKTKDFKKYYNEFEVKSSPLLKTFKFRKGLLIEDNWVPGVLTNRESLRKSYLKLNTTPLRFFFPQIQKNKNLIEYLKNKKHIQKNKFNRIFSKSIGLINLPQIVILLSNKENGPLLNESYSLLIPSFSTNNGLKKRFFHCDYSIFVNSDNESLPFLEEIFSDVLGNNNSSKSILNKLLLNSRKLKNNLLEKNNFFFE